MRRFCDRRRSDRGATLVELAIVSLLVFTMFLAIFEFGLLFRDNLTATDAVSDATRIGAIVGPDVNAGATADYEIVKAVGQGLSALDERDVRTIVVFRASGSADDAEAQVPVTCRNGISRNSICNAYDAREAFAAVAGGNVAYFRCEGTNTAACPYDPEQRKDGPQPSDVETIGVYVLIERSGYTGFFADSWTISRAATARLEPGTIQP